MGLLNATPYWRLSGFYFCYFASLGVLLPYWTLYLAAQGFTAREIGQLTAILLITRIVAPTIWAWVVNLCGHRMQTVRWASFIAALAFAAMLVADSYLAVAVITLCFSFFWHAPLAQFETATLQHLGTQHHHYSKIRLWGSIGFIIAVIVIGKLVDNLNTDIIPPAILVALTTIWLVSLTVPESSALPKDPHHDNTLTALLTRADVIAFLIICLLLQLSHGPYYTFYTLYLESYGYSTSLIGSLWALGPIAEMAVFLFMHRWLTALGSTPILLISLLLATVRWLMIGFSPQSLTMLLVAQLLHAASFGAFHAAAIAWVYQHFSGNHQGLGQALYSGIGFGAGGALGSLISGYLWLSPGPTTTFNLAAMMTLLAFIIGMRWLK